MNPSILIIVFILVLLHIYFIIPFMILMIMMPKIKKARKKEQRIYIPTDYKSFATERLYRVNMTRSEVIEILSNKDYSGRTYGCFEKDIMQLRMRDSQSESLYSISIREERGGCIITVKLIGRAYSDTSFGKLNSFFGERFGPCLITPDDYSKMNQVNIGNKKD